VFNQAFRPELLSYGSRYENSQTWSPLFLNHVEGLVRYLTRDRGVQNSLVVEVGCGNGDFLKMLVEPTEIGNTGVGFDPSYSGPGVQLGGRLTFRKCFYRKGSTSRPADVIICRHVIEHVQRPKQLLGSFESDLRGSLTSRLFIETPCVEWILQNRVIWDFFYEHCSLFTEASLTRAVQSAGLDACAARRLFGGQYIWHESTSSSGSHMPNGHCEAVREMAGEYAAAEASIIEDWRSKVRKWASDAPLALWGAAAKGCTLANLVDPHAEFIDCIIDINPAKQGHYLPGTGHAIVGAEEMRARGIAKVILMNPNYREEIAEAVAHVGARTELVE